MSKKTKQPPVLFKQTQNIVKKVEAKLGYSMVSYWNSYGGSIVGNDIVAIYEIMQNIGKKDKLLLFVKSGGGNGESALRIIHVLRQYTKHITALIPLECASAATMMVLGANEIQMGALAYLTPVDTSLTHDLSPIDRDNDRVAVSHDELNRVVKLWQQEAKFDSSKNPYEVLYQYIHPLVIGAIDRSDSLSMKLCKEILSYHIMDEEKADRISQCLNSEYPSHSYPITLKEAQKIGLHATELDPEVSELLLELNHLYSEMGQDAITDFDEHNYHNNAILNIMEGQSVQVFYQIDKDWHYLKDERRWTSLNNESGWHKISDNGTDTPNHTRIYIR